MGTPKSELAPSSSHIILTRPIRPAAEASGILRVAKSAAIQNNVAPLAIRPGEEVPKAEADCLRE